MDTQYSKKTDLLLEASRALNLSASQLLNLSIWYNTRHGKNGRVRAPAEGGRVVTLKLNGLEVLCIIGDRVDERHRLQSLRVDVELELPSAAADRDRLSDTVDYAALTEAVRAALVAAKCQMIEHAAKVAFDACAAACGAAAGARPRRVTVTKSGSVPGLESASAAYP